MDRLCRGPDRVGACNASDAEMLVRVRDQVSIVRATLDTLGGTGLV
jgi:hypothetical protein